MYHDRRLNLLISDQMLVDMHIRSHIADNKNRGSMLLVGCFGLNGPLRQYFSLYRAVSQREGERKDK